MKLYRKMIKPVLYCWDPEDCETKKKDLEHPVVWYPEGQTDAVLERFKDLNNIFENVGLDEEYIEDTEPEKEEYFKSEKEMVAWLNEFAAEQSDYENFMRLTEISIKLHISQKDTEEGKE